MLLRLVNYAKFSRTLRQAFDIPCQVKDVTKLRGQKDSPYFIVNSKRYYLPIKQLLAEYDSQDDVMIFRNQDYQIYHIATPFIALLASSFYLNLNGECYFVLNNQPIICSAETQQFNQLNCPPILQTLCRTTIQEIVPGSIFSGYQLHNLLMDSILKSAERIKLEKIRMQQLLKVVRTRLSHFDSHIALAKEKLERHALLKRRLISGMMVSQVAILHYFIYFSLSWDIMEPVTVILGNFDLFFGYYYFIVRGKDFSFENFEKGIIEARLNKYLKKNGVDVDKYEQLLEIQEYLVMRIEILSKNPRVAMKRLSKDIKLLDTS